MKQKNVILMIVAVGCGLVAAFLTSQMSAKATVETVDVIVAAKDLPVGTTITRDDIKDDKNALVKIKKLPKDGLPPAFITNKDDLVDKRLSRPIRAEETFNPQDLTKGGITLPEGYDMVSLPVGVGQAAAGFIGPGSRVNVLATVRTANKLYAFPLLVNMLVIAVDQQQTYDPKGVFPSMNMVSFAVTEKQALLLSLAKSRGCSLELMLRHPNKSVEADVGYDIDKVIKLMSDEKEGQGGEIKPLNPAGEPNGPFTPPVKPTPVEPGPSVKPTPVDPPAAGSGLPSAPYPHEKVLVAKVLVAKRDIAPNTEVTADLVAAAFEYKALPVEFIGDAMGDLNEGLGKYLKTGVSKGQWVTPSMLGLQSSKGTPRETWLEFKPVQPADPKPSDVKPVQVKRAIHDVTVTTASGTLVHRYEEVAPGKWKVVAIMTPEQAARDDVNRQPAPRAPEAAPDANKKVD